MPARATFRPDVEGLRGLAVLAVVLYHARLAGFSGGYAGVDVFFVLSGYLITGLLWREATETGRVALGAFYARRARRLLPAAAVVLVFTVVSSALVLSPLRAAGVARDGVAAAGYVANYRFAAVRTDYLGSDAVSPLLHFWSLAVEEQFYLVWPVLLAAVAARRVAARRARRRPPTPTLALAVVALVSFAAALWLASVSQPWAFFSLPTRAWELAAGGLVALRAPRLALLRPAIATRLGWAGLAAIGFSVVAYGPTTPFPGVATLLPVAGTVLVLAAGSARRAGRPSGAAAVLRAPLLRALGRVSYSWYLWHFPVLVLADAVAGRPLPAWVTVPLALATLVPAALTKRLVEDPIRFAPRLERNNRGSLAMGGAVTALAGVVAVVALVVVPSPVGSGGPAVAPPLAGPPARTDVAANKPVVSGGAPGRPVAAAPASPAYDELLASVTRAVAEAAGTAAVPSNLTPSLERAHADKARPFVDGCNLSFAAVTLPRCEYGESASEATSSIVLYGDSHAAQWWPALRPLAGPERRLVTLAKATCPPAGVEVYSPVLGRRYRECETFRSSVLSRVERLARKGPTVVVLGAARHYDERLYRFAVYGEEWVDGLASTVRALRAAGAAVIVLGPTPKPRVDVPDCLAGHLDDAAACVTSLDDAVAATGSAAERVAVRDAGGAYVDVAPWLCAATCPVVVGDMLVYRDDNHLTTAYAGWLSPLFAAMLDRADPAS